jgi:PD-(D/E)XK endonuclease
MEHPKAVGDRSTLAIITVLRELGYGVYLPFGENTRCDLILERGEKLSRVQCKTGRLRQRAIAFAVCSCYGHHRNPQRPVASTPARSTSSVSSARKRRAST